MSRERRNVAAAAADTGPQPENRPVDELLFWINCLGAAVLVVEKHAPIIRYANGGAASLFLREADDLRARPVSEVIGNEAEQLLGQVWCTSAVGTAGEPFLIRGHVNGQDRLLMVRATKIVIDGGPLRLFTFTDAPPEGSVTLAGWQDNMMEILNWFPFGLEISDNNDAIQFANAHCRELFGREQHELESVEDWWRLSYPDPDYRHYARTKWDTEIAAARRENREMTPFDLEVATAGGGFRTIQFRHRTIGSFNINLFLDVTRERAYQRELKALAETDPLTGVMNRRSFFDAAAPFFSADASSHVAILVLDIDHFKLINDAYGHGGGDLVLQEFTRRCVDVMPKGARFARFGGEEFAILLPGLARAAARSTAEYLRARIETEPFRIPSAELSVTVSVGATVRRPGDTLDGMISRADKALYQAKRQGRNRIVLK
jgi:diguanylate cyclase (GGDEF)-like protein